MKGPPTRYRLRISSASARSSGVKSSTWSSASPNGSIGSGQATCGWVSAVQLPGTTVCSTSRSSMGQTGSPVSRLNVKIWPVFDVWITAGTASPSTSRSTTMGTLGRS